MVCATYKGKSLLAICSNHLQPPSFLFLRFRFQPNQYLYPRVSFKLMVVIY